MTRILCALLLILAAAGGSLADELEVPHIVVYGTAETEVVPDQMLWRLTVKNLGEELSVVAEEHSRTVEQVLATVSGSGVPRDDLQTSRMEFGENWRHERGSRLFDGYFAATRVSFKTKDLDSYLQLWSSLARIEGVSVDGVHYDLSERIEIQNETRRKALLAARDKAQDLAETLGVRMGEPLLIEEDPPGIGPEKRLSMASNVRQAVGEGAGGGGGLAPGRIPIKMRVRVAFRLITEG
jgi:uncharacterized protein YggE